DKTKAVIEASSLRLRPILMTSIATLAAAVPPALNFGPGAETRIPMALGILGGVSVSTVLTLLVVPVLYEWLSPERKPLLPDEPDAKSGQKREHIFDDVMVQS